MIEFLPPRDDAFGERDTADFVGVDGDDDSTWGDEPPRSRWLTALAVLGVTGLLAGGVIAAAPWDDPDAAPPPTTTPPTTTVPRPSTTVARTEPTLPRDFPTTPAGWIPADDGSLQLTYAYSVGDSTLQVPPGMTGLQVFSSDDATHRTSGRWIVIDPEPQSMSSYRLRRSAVVTSAGDRRVLVSAAADGTVTLDVEVFPGSSSAPPLTITSFGMPLDELLVVAATVDLVWDGNVRSLDLSGAQATGVFAGLSLRWDAPLIRWSPGNAYGTAVASSDVVDEQTGIWSRIDLVRPDAERRAVGRLLDVVPLAVDELPVELQRRLDELARRGWQLELASHLEAMVTVARAPLPDGDDLVVATSGDVDDLLDVVGSIRPAADDEWVDLITRGYDTGFATPDVDVEQWHVALGSDTEWSADLWGIPGGATTFALGTGMGFLSEPFVHGQGPELIEYRSLDDAFVRATTTFANEARYVTIAQERTVAARSKLVGIGTTGVLGVVVRVDPDLPYTVTWSDEAGDPVDGPIDAAASASESAP